VNQVKYFQLQEKLWTDEDVVSREQSQTTWSVDIRGCASIMLTTFYNLDDPLFLHFYE
jgi:hypothetical protein